MPAIPSVFRLSAACPPEDCGGAWGYQNFLEAIRSTEHPEHEEMLDWVGGSFNPEEVDLEEIKLLVNLVPHDVDKLNL